MGLLVLTLPAMLFRLDSLLLRLVLLGMEVSRVGLGFPCPHFVCWLVLCSTFVLPFCRLGSLLLLLNGFLLGRAKKEDVPCRFCGGKDGYGHLFWECPFLPIQSVRDHPEFLSLMNMDRSKWPRCLLWHGWLPGLSCIGQGDPWAASVGQLADLALESSLGAYPAGDAHLWVPLIFGMRMTLLWKWLIVPTFRLMVVGQCTLSVGLKLLVLVCTCLLLSLLFEGSVWRTVEEYGDARLERCRIFLPVPGVMQTVQRAEFFKVLFLPCRRTGLVI